MPAVLWILGILGADCFLALYRQEVKDSENSDTAKAKTVFSSISS